MVTFPRGIRHGWSSARLLPRPTLSILGERSINASRDGGKGRAATCRVPRRCVGNCGESLEWKWGRVQPGGTWTTLQTLVPSNARQAWLLGPTLTRGSGFPTFSFHAGVVPRGQGRCGGDGMAQRRRTARAPAEHFVYDQADSICCRGSLVETQIGSDRPRHPPDRAPNRPAVGRSCGSECSRLGSRQHMRSMYSTVGGHQRRFGSTDCCLESYHRIAAARGRADMTLD
jgi:hypothetical protein